MQRILVAALLVASLGGLGMAEEVPELFGFGGGGALVGLLPFDLAPLNAALTGAGFPALEGPVVVFGGEGGGGVLGGLAFGGLGFRGGLTGLAADRRTDLGVWFGGFLAEGVRPVARSVHLGFGAVLGGGGLDLTARARHVTDFADALAEPTLSQFSLGFLGGLAYLRLQIQALDWLAIEGWLGYFLAFPGRWSEGGREIAGPRLDLRAPFVGLQILFGGVVALEDLDRPE